MIELLLRRVVSSDVDDDPPAGEELFPQASRSRQDSSDTRLTRTPETREAMAFRFYPKSSQSGRRQSMPSKQPAIGRRRIGRLSRSSSSSQSGATDGATGGISRSSRSSSREAISARMSALRCFLARGETPGSVDRDTDSQRPRRSLSGSHRASCLLVARETVGSRESRTPGHQPMLQLTRSVPDVLHVPRLRLTLTCPCDGNRESLEAVDC